jgi:hypothetical protein
VTCTSFAFTLDSAYSPLYTLCNRFRKRFRKRYH